LGSYGVGLPLAMPVVRAINATRYRDVQNVTVRTDLHKFNPATKQFELAARGDEFRGLAADDNYVVSFQNLRTGADQLVRERLLWQLTTNGFYRVAQYITWHRNGRVPSFTRKAWLFHSPGPQNQFCFIQ
jgi:hypothetical protein